jgi:hypothetical protein
MNLQNPLENHHKSHVKAEKGPQQTHDYGSCLVTQLDQVNATYSGVYFVIIAMITAMEEPEKRAVPYVEKGWACRA